MEGKKEQIFIPIIFIALVTVFPAAFLVGRWIGRRSASRGILTVLLVAIISRGLATFFDLVLLSETEYQDVQSALGMGFGKQFMVGIIDLFILGSIGYWRGQKQCLSFYLDYLLRNVPETSRKIIVELAFEEASKGSKR